jgi:rod shape-determining protein MreC
MAPPTSRRPGFSRRAQYSLFVGYIIAVLGVLVAALLLITAHFDPKGHSALRALLGDIASPFSALGRSVARGGNGALEGVSAYVQAGSKNRALTAEVLDKRAKLIEGQNALLENQRLKALLRIAQTEPGPLIAARIISTTGESSRRYAMLDKGVLHGIAIGEPVRATLGLVGQVIETGAISSRVLLISDTGNIVPVKRVTDGVTAFANGTGDGLLTVIPVIPGSGTFNRGDIFVTSGAGGVYPPGIPVAVVVSIGRDGANARTLADLGQLDFALVERPFVAPPPAPTEIKAKAKKHRVAAE